MRGVSVVSFLLLATLLAGCGSSGGGDGGETVVTSNLPDVTEVASGEEAPKAEVEPPKQGTRGHIAGYVVTSDIRPIEGAVVKLPGMDLEQVTDRDGSFGFVDLRPGPYYLTVNVTGYYGAESEVIVKADSFSRLKFVLTPIPPPEPYHKTDVFEAYAEIGETSLFATGFFCYSCQNMVYLDGRPETLIVEAVSEGATSGGYQFYLREGSCCSVVMSGSFADPMRVEIDGESLFLDQYEVEVYPEAVIPETQRRFQIFVTAFYNQPAPEGWTFANDG